MRYFVCTLFFFIFQIIYSQSYSSEPAPLDLLKKAREYAAVKNFKQAKEAIDEAVRIDPGFTEGWRERGKIYYWDEKYKEALKNFETVLFLLPGDIEATTFHLKLNLLLENNDNALKTFGKLVKLGGDISPKLFLNLYKATLNTKSRLQTLNIVKTYLKRELGRDDRLWGNFIFNLMNGNPLKAEKNLNMLKGSWKAVPHLKGLLTEGYFLTGQSYLKQKNYASAAANLKIAASMRPEWYPPLRGLGWAYLGKNKLSKAVRTWEIALRYSPDKENTLLLIVKAQIEAGSLKGAESTLKKLFKEYPDSLKGNIEKVKLLIRKKLIKEAKILIKKIEKETLDEDLVKDLTAFLPKRGVYKYEGEGGDVKNFIRDWYSSEGQVSVSENRLIFQPDNRNNRTTFWLKGSRHIGNVLISFDIKNNPDIRWSFYLRYDNSSSYLKVNLDGLNISILQKHEENLVTTAEKKIAVSGNERLKIKLMVKNNRLFVWLNGENLFPSPEYLFPDVQTGLVGVSLTFNKKRVSAPIYNIVFKSLPDIRINGESLDNIDRNHLSYVNVFSPPVNNFLKKNESSTGISKLNVLAKFYGIKIMPEILLNEFFSQEIIETLLLKKDSFDGITVVIEKALMPERIEILRKNMEKIIGLGLGKISLAIDNLMLSTLLEDSYIDIIKKADSIILFPGENSLPENVHKTLKDFSGQFESKKIIPAFDVSDLKRISIENLKRPIAEGLLDKTINIIDDYKNKLNIFLYGISYR